MKANPHKRQDALLAAALLMLTSSDALPAGAEDVIYAASRRLRKLSEMPHPDEVCSHCGKVSTTSTNRHSPDHTTWYRTCPEGHSWPSTILGGVDDYESWA